MWSDEVTNLGTKRNAKCQPHNLNVGRKGVVRRPETIHGYIRLANHTVLYRIIFYNNQFVEYSIAKERISYKQISTEIQISDTYEPTLLNVIEQQ